MGRQVNVIYTLPRGEFQVSGKTTLVNMPGGKGFPLELTRVAIAFAGFTFIALGFLLLLIGTLQLRGVLKRRRLEVSRTSS
jgi:hypothetical protein